MTKNEALAQYRESLFMLRKQILQVETNLTRLEVAMNDKEASQSPSRHLLKDIKICSNSLDVHMKLS